MNDTMQKLIDAGRILDKAGFGDLTRGHLSARVPEQPETFYMKPHSVGFDELSADNILTIDREGNVVAGTARRHSEVFIHSEIYKARPDVGAVIHAHPTHTIALSALKAPIRPISQGGAVFTDCLPVYTGTIDLIRRPDQGRDVATALGPHQAVLMRHHGVAVAARSIEEAAVLLEMLETAAEIQLRAMAAGELADEFPPEDVQRLKQKLIDHEQFVINFQYLRRKLL